MTTFQLSEQSFKDMQEHILIKQKQGMPVDDAQERVKKIESLKNIVYRNENEFREALEKKVPIKNEVYKSEIMPYVFTQYFSAMEFIVMAFFNLIIIGGIAILLTHISPSLFPSCIRIEVKIIAFAITLLLFFHLCWRFLRQAIIALGEIINIKFVTISIGKCTLLLDALHPWWIDSRILFFINIILFFIVGVSYVYSPFFLRPIDETIPSIQNFFIKRLHAKAPTISIEPDNMLTITTNERISVSPTQAETEDHTACCEWFSNRGRLEHSGKSCSILYTAPLKEGNDTLTLKMQSPCKTQEAYASLHIRIVTP